MVVSARRVALAVTSALAAPVGIAAAAVDVPSGEPWIVMEVTDGDTLDVVQGTTVLTVRLIGINAPESGECFADDATLLLTNLVGAGPVWLVSDRSDVDQYGRALRYVLDGDGNDVGALLVDQGAAIARRYPPDVANDLRYSLLQTVASDEGRGLWAPNACSPASQGVLLAGVPATISIALHPDAAGDDNDNLNDEWVRFTNTGSDSIDLDGWTVRDESSSHRYRISDLAVPAGGSFTLYTGCGTDTATERYWCNTGSAVWNNGGDTVLLLDPNGNVVAQSSY